MPVKIEFTTEDNKHILIEQYKLILSSLDKLNDIREVANNFWITVNIAGVSAIAYLKDQAQLNKDNKSYLIYTIIIVGILICVGWIRNLNVIKQGVNIRNDLLISIEKKFPAQVFTNIIRTINKNKVKPSITESQMIVPLIFLISYIVFAFLAAFNKDMILL